MNVNKEAVFRARMVSFHKGRNGELAQKFGCTLPFVSQSLNFKVKSEKARRIRDYAANRMGYIVMLAQ